MAQGNPWSFDMFPQCMQGLLSLPLELCPLLLHWLLIYGQTWSHLLWLGIEASCFSHWQAPSQDPVRIEAKWPMLVPEAHQLTVIMVHIDDCTITVMNLALIGHLKNGIKRFIEITDMGELHWLLGIKIRRNREVCSVSLFQHTYIKSIIHQFRFEDLKPISTPMDPSAKLSAMQSPLTGSQYATMIHIPYWEAISTLMYAMLSTWPDISYMITQISKYLSNPGTPHWEGMKHVYRYLAGTMNMWLSFGGEVKELTGYANVDGSMGEDWHALSGYAYIIDGSAVSWSTKRQETVSLLTTESEYVATMHAAKEGLWLQLLITQLFGPLSSLTTLFSDNQSAIALTKDHQYHAQTKHINVCFHFIQWIIEDGKLCLIYCPTTDMVADTFTKALPLPKVKHFMSELGLCNAWGEVLDEQALGSHLLVPSLLYHMSYCYALLDSLLWPIIISTLTCCYYSFCTYYSCTTKTSSVLNYDRSMYSPQRLSPAVQLWGMFPVSPLTTYYTHTYKSCRCDKLQVNILQRLSPAVQLWDMINYKCEVRQSKRQGNRVSEYMLRDKRHWGLGVKRSVQVKRALAKSELGELLLLYFSNYRWAKYGMAIMCADIMVKPLLAMWPISWIQYLHV